MISLDQSQEYEEKTIERIPIIELESIFETIESQSDLFRPMGPFKLDLENPANANHPLIELDPLSSLVLTDSGSYTHSRAYFNTNSQSLIREDNLSKETI